MSKKDLINNFFNQPKSNKVPVSISETDSNSYKKRKIFDDPAGSTEEESIIEIDTNDVYVSQYKVDRDRLDFEKLEHLADNMLSVGQLQPCTVRHNPQNGKAYELIFGERRYRAAILRNLKLKVVVKDIDIATSALQLLSENRNREDNSDYSLYLQINKFVSNNILKQKDIVDKTGISKQKISKLMCFSKLPEIITNKISDMSKISATTAEAIYAVTKSNDNIDAIISISDKIETGEYGHSKILSYVKKYNSKTHDESSNTKIYGSDGRHLFTIRKDNNKCQSIHFPKDIMALFNNDRLNRDNMYEALKDFIENNIDKI